MLSEKEVEQLKEWCRGFFHNAEQDYMEFDSEAEIDRNLTLLENKSLLTHKINAFLEFNKDNKLTKKQITELDLKPMDAGEVKEMEEKSWNTYREEHKEEYDEPINLDKVNVIAILGNIDEGKSNLSFWYMNSYKGKRQKCLYGYPKKIKGYKNIDTFPDLMKIENSIVFIDEFSKYFQIYDKNTNQQLIDFLVLMAHKNNTLILTTQLSQMLTRQVEAFIDCWAFKRLDLNSLKWGSKAKRVINSLAYWKKNAWVLDLKKDEYFQYSERDSNNGIKRFPFQNIGKDWA